MDLRFRLIATVLLLPPTGSDALCVLAPRRMSQRSEATGSGFSDRHRRSDASAQRRQDSNALLVRCGADPLVAEPAVLDLG